MAVALDEIIAIGSSSWQVRRRVDRLLSDLIAIAPEHAGALRARVDQAQQEVRR